LRPSGLQLLSYLKNKTSSHLPSTLMLNQQIKVLLVEDNPGDVLLLQETLSEITVVSFNLVHVERLSKALKQLEAETFDVILLDLLLPDSDGLETFTTIHQRVPHTPIVVLTGMSDETLALSAMQAGAQDYLVKGRVSGGDLLMRSMRYAIERKRVESILHQRERELRTLTEHAPDIISRFDRDLRYLFINLAVEAITGISAADFLGKMPRDMGLPESLVNQWEMAVRSVQQTGEGMTIEQEFSTQGAMRYYQTRFVPEFGSEGAVETVLGITRDITEQKQLQVQLFRAQRLESLGRFSSGIAHDMNNILTPILAVAQLLPMKLPDLDAQNQHLLQMLEDSARRGSDLVKQILTFSRGLEGVQSSVQIEQILSEIEQILKSTFPEWITLVFDRSTTSQLWQVMADATQLHQVLMNFCVNARDAMSEPGTLKITAENRRLDMADAGIDLEAKPGNYVVVTISDTGVGIPQHHIDRIFEPFFTTKDVGKGTGLGLATAIGIIKNHGGFVTVESEVGKGTQFQIFLPAITRSVLPTENSHRYPIGQGEVVLVVDDEAQIREALRITLEYYNYQVITAKDGMEAIAIYTDQKQSINCILMDIKMPLMDGMSVIPIITQLNPQAKIIVFSGTATSETLAPLANIQAFLPKPYTAEALLEALHRILNIN
jgi:two-component system, cell cycle sensor histidine kinase and response regulator CckA